MKKKENDLSQKINIRPLIFPMIAFAGGLGLCIVYAPRTTYVNGGVAVGLLIMCVGTILYMSAYYKEIHRIGKETPFPLSMFFPSYPIVGDKNEIAAHISGFRRAYSEFMAARSASANSQLQNYSSQLLWHCLFLQKKRMEKLGLGLQFQSFRRAYTPNGKSVRSEIYFDGRYDVKDVSEEIDSIRRFCYKGRVIKELNDKEVAHYTLLSAKETDSHEVICPNCGVASTKANLLDGCDYCGTKFTVEDIENSVASFGFRRDFTVSESKKSAVIKLIYPWISMISTLPLLYFGFFGPFLYITDESIFFKLLSAILGGGLLGVFGWLSPKITMIFIVPIIYGFSSSWGKENRNIIYREQEELVQERSMAEYVRKFDPKFSIQSFFGGVQNKLSAIHYADKKEQINAFSDVDISGYLDSYRNVVDVDIMKMTLSSYEVKDGMQHATVRAEMVLRSFLNGKMEEKSENIKLILSKSERCKSQSVCAPSMLTCSSCGASLSLIEGKKCAYCGRELDLKNFDWVITEYNKETNPYSTVFDWVAAKYDEEIAR